MGEQDEAAATAIALRKEQQFAASNIREITQKGSFNITVKCRTDDDAIIMENELVKKYANKILITPPKEYPPMVKVTNLIIEETIKKGNFWASELKFKIFDIYNVQTRAGEYSNVVISCDIATQKTFLDKQKLIYGFAS